MSTCDAATSRTTDDGEEVKWDTSTKKYIKKWSQERCVVNFNGKFTAHGKRLANIEELLGASGRASPKKMTNEGLLFMNEVVVDWNKESIVGIVCTKYVHAMSDRSLASEDQLKRDALALRTELTKQTSVSPPVFLYDHLEGDLNSMDDI